MPKIAFLLLTHDANPHLERLTRTLLEFPNSKIFCHHDFSKGKPHSALTSTAHFCMPSRVTDWGRISLFLAELDVMKLAYDKMPDAEWFILLSGSCYPIKSADHIQKFLEDTPFDGFMDFNAAKPGLHLPGWWWKKVYTQPLVSG